MEPSTNNLSDKKDQMLSQLIDQKIVQPRFQEDQQRGE